MGKDDDFWGALAGLALGAIGIAVLAELAKPSCPSCKKKIQRGAESCPYCYASLEWK